MDKKAQMGIGDILMIAVIVIVGVVLFQVIAQEVGDSTNTVAVANTSLTTVVDDTAQYLTDYRALSGTVILNETNSTGGTEAIPIIGSGNYTVTNNVIDPTTGALSVQVLPGTVTAGYKSAWQVSGTAEPVTYIGDGGARAVAGLIVIFFALAIAVVAISPTVRSGLAGMVGK